MKKILLSLALVVMCASAVSAQLIQRNPVAQLMPHRAAIAPVQKVLGPNQLYMGPYMSDALADYGLGLSRNSGIFKQGTILPIEMVKPFEGGQVKAIRFGLCAAVSDGAVFVYPVTSLSPLTLGQPLAQQQVASTTAGWNLVELDNPFTVSTQGMVGLMIGYQYRQNKGNTDDCYPISMVDEGTILSTYTNAPGVTNGWEDIDLSSYGNLSVQAIVESDNFPQYNLVLRNLKTYNYARIADGIDYEVALANEGIATLDSYTIEVLVDNVVRGTIDSPVALTPSEKAYRGHCALDGLTSGHHTLALRATAVARQTVTDGATVSTTFNAYHDAFSRQKHLVEQFTAQGSAYSPYGDAVLEALQQVRDGDLEWVAIHNNYNGSDVFTITQGTSLANYLGVTTYPTASFDRFDAQLTGNLMTSISYYPQQAQQVAADISGQYYDNNPTPALATIDIEPAYDQATRQLTITVTGNVSSDYATVFGASTGLSVYLTEDGLVARQNNGGTWVSAYTYNHVLRAMPSAYNGDLVTLTGNRYKKTYQVTLNSAWKPENMRIVALLHRRGTGTDKEVINCEGVQLIADAGITGDVTGDGQVDIADVNAIINMMLGKADKTAAADATGDGAVDIADVNAVINIMLGKQ